MQECDICYEPKQQFQKCPKCYNLVCIDCIRQVTKCPFCRIQIKIEPSPPPSRQRPMPPRPPPPRPINEIIEERNRQRESDGQVNGFFQNRRQPQFYPPHLYCINPYLF